MRVWVPEDQDRLMKDRRRETKGNPATRIAHHNVTHNVYYVKSNAMLDISIST